MSRVVILGATGSLGRQVVQQAMAAGHEVAVVVRTPEKLTAEVRDTARVHQCDLSAASTSDLTAMLANHEALINAAGHVSEGQVFVALVDRLVTSLEAVPTAARPVCWFLAGAGLLDIDGTGRRGLDLPRIRATYWPHRVNYERLQRSNLDWRLLCPGPMVDQPPLGLAGLRLSLDRLPVQVPGFSRVLPAALLLPLFVQRIPEMIIPYADAAALMLQHLTPGGEMSRHRVGIALPLGMKGRKDRWSAQPGRDGGLASHVREAS
jgi:putative NADH-flavin reductase